MKKQENPVVEANIRTFTQEFRHADFFRNKTILITGATGFIGSILIKCLVDLNKRHDCGMRIIAMARDPEKVARKFGDLEVSWHYGDISAPVSIEEKVDYIIHCASPTASRYFVEHPVETLQAIYGGTTVILDFARKCGVESMVFLSSLESYGVITTDVAVTEEMSGQIDVLTSRSSYPLGKRLAENLCHAYCDEYGVPVKIARLTQIFGPGFETDDNRVCVQFARKLLSGEDIELHTSGGLSRPYCHIIDSINAIITILMKGSNGEAYNVANASTFISVKDMAEILTRNFRPEGKVIYKADPGNGYGAETLLRLDTSRLEKLGWKPSYDLLQMFAEALDYMEANKPVNDSL